MPTPDELRDVHLENAKVDQRFWEGLRRVHTDTIGKVTKALSVPQSELSPLAQQAPRTPPSTPRRLRNGLSEASAARQVQSGPGKSR